MKMPLSACSSIVKSYFVLLFLFIMCSCDKFGISNSKKSSEHTSVLSKNKKNQEFFSSSNSLLGVHLNNEYLKQIPSNFLPFLVVKSDQEQQASSFLESRGILNQEKYICIADKSNNERETYQNILECVSKFRSQFNKSDIFKHVVNAATDDYVLIGAKLRTHLQLASELQETFVSRFVDKYIMKNVLLKNDKTIKTADYLKISNIFGSALELRQNLEQAITDTFGSSWSTLVVKPSKSSASRGVFIVSNDDNFTDKLENISKEIFSDKSVASVIVEEFIEGRVLRMDGYVKNGSLGANFTSSYHIPPKDFYHLGDPQLTILKSENEDRKRYDQFTQQVAYALEFRNGPFHLEAIESTSGELYFLEISIRPGGTLASTLSHIGFNPRRSFVLQQLGLEYEAHLKEDPTFGVIAVHPPFWSKNSEFYIDLIEYKPLDHFSSYMDDFSYIPREAGMQVSRFNRFIEVAFIGDSNLDAEADAREFFNSLKIHLKSIDHDEEVVLDKGKWSPAS